MNTKIIEYYAKNNYGITSFYVSDKSTRDIISKLTGRKTITRADADALRALGFETIQTTPPETL